LHAFALSPLKDSGLDLTAFALSSLNDSDQICPHLPYHRSKTATKICPHLPYHRSTTAIRFVRICLIIAQTTARNTHIANERIPWASEGEAAHHQHTTEGGPHLSTRSLATSWDFSFQANISSCEGVLI